MMKRAIAVGSLCVVLAACGSSSKQGAGPPTSGATTPPTSASPSTGRTSRTTRSPSAVPAPPRATPGKTGVPSPRGTMDGATVSLSQTCTRRGVDQQTITFDTTPGDAVSYRSVYSDGSNSTDGHSHYSSGDGGAIEGNPYTDPDGKEDGHWAQTWTVPANAPTGLTNVIATTSHGYTYLTFNIVGRTGRCS